MTLEAIKAVFEAHPEMDIIYEVNGMPFVGDDPGKREAHNYSVKTQKEIITWKRKEVLAKDQSDRAADDEQGASPNGDADKNKAKK